MSGSSLCDYGEVSSLCLKLFQLEGGGYKLSIFLQSYEYRNIRADVNANFKREG